MKRLLILTALAVATLVLLSPGSGRANHGNPDCNYHYAHVYTSDRLAGAADHFEYTCAPLSLDEWAALPKQWDGVEATMSPIFCWDTPAYQVDGTSHIAYHLRIDKAGNGPSQTPGTSHWVEVGVTQGAGGIPGRDEIYVPPSAGWFYYVEWGDFDNNGNNSWYRINAYGPITVGCDDPITFKIAHDNLNPGIWHVYANGQLLESRYMPGPKRGSMTAGLETAVEPFTGDTEHPPYVNGFLSMAFYEMKLRYHGGINWSPWDMTPYAPNTTSFSRIYHESCQSGYPAGGFGNFDGEPQGYGFWSFLWSDAFWIYEEMDCAYEGSISYSLEELGLAAAETLGLCSGDDVDGDGWSECAELYFGTDPDNACGDQYAWPPDFNGNGIVQVDDVGYVSSRFGLEPLDENYDPRAELSSQNGIIQVDDVSLINSMFGQTCQ